MCFDAIRWAMNQRDLTAPQKWTLVAFANYASRQHWNAWPSYAALVELTGLNRKTIVASVAHLRDNDLILDTGARKGRRVVVYRVWQGERRAKPRKSESPENGTFKRSESPENGTFKSTRKSQKRTQKVPKTGRGTNQEPVNSESASRRALAMTGNPEISQADREKINRVKRELEKEMQKGATAL